MKELIEHENSCSLNILLDKVVRDDNTSRIEITDRDTGVLLFKEYVDKRDKLVYKTNGSIVDTELTVTLYAESIFTGEWTCDITMAYSRDTNIQVISTDWIGGEDNNGGERFDEGEFIARINEIYYLIGSCSECIYNGSMEGTPKSKYAFCTFHKIHIPILKSLTCDDFERKGDK